MFHITKNLTLTLWCYFPAKKLEIKKTKISSFFSSFEFYMQNLRFWYQKLKRWMKVSSFRSPCAPCDWSFMTKIDTLFVTRMAENPTLWGHTTYIAHKRDSPLGVWPSGFCVRVWSGERGCRPGSFVRSMTCTCTWSINSNRNSKGVG